MCRLQPSVDQRKPRHSGCTIELNEVCFADSCFNGCALGANRDYVPLISEAGRHDAHSGYRPTQNANSVFQEPLSANTVFQEPLSAKNVFQEPLSANNVFQEPLSANNVFQERLSEYSKPAGLGATGASHSSY